MLVIKDWAEVPNPHRLVTLFIDRIHQRELMTSVTEVTENSGCVMKKSSFHRIRAFCPFIQFSRRYDVGYWRERLSVSHLTMSLMNCNINPSNKRYPQIP